MTEHDHSHHAHQGIDRRGLLAAGAGGLLVLATPGTAFAGPGPNGHPCNDFGLAYSSPWWLQP